MNPAVAYDTTKINLTFILWLKVVNWDPLSPPTPLQTTLQEQ